MKYDKITAIKDREGNILSAEHAGLAKHPSDIKWYLSNKCELFCFCRECGLMHSITTRCYCGAETMIAPTYSKYI